MTEPSPAAVLEGVFANSGVGLCLIDAGGVIRRVNGAWLASAQREEAEVVGRGVWQVFPEASPEQRALFERARRGEVVDLPPVAQRVGAGERWYAGRLSPVPFPSGTGVLVALWDVSAAKRVEHAIAEDHDRLRRHVVSTPLALVEWDGDYRVIGYSKRAEELFGFSAGEVLGRRIDEIPWVPEEDWPSVRAVMRDMWTAARPTNVNANRNVRKDGRVIHCEWYNSALHDASGKLVSMLSLVLDVTPRHEAAEALRASEARARAVMDNVRDHLAILEAVRDPSGAVVDWRYADANDSALALLGRDRVVIGRSMREVLGPERSAPREERLRKVLETGVRERYESSFGGRALLVTLFRVDERRVASGSVDITDLKRAEEELRAANERLREADRRKDEFLAMLSHELRNPLAPIRNAVTILTRSADGEQLARARAVIGRQVAHMARLIDDLLDVTRVARGIIELRREPTDLVQVVRRAAEDHRPMFSERGVALALDLPAAPVWLDGDGTRLTQVVGNLLQNAAKFTAQGGQVTVSLAARGGEAELRVADTGVGIPPELLGRIFEPFVQGDQSLARTHGGLGLGLALVRGLVELHGGAVSAESPGAGGGATFVVRLPVSPGSPG